MTTKKVTDAVSAVVTTTGKTVAEALGAKHKRGELMQLDAGVQVQRPDGNTHTVSGGYVFDVPGTYVVDGTEVQVS